MKILAFLQSFAFVSFASWAGSEGTHLPDPNQPEALAVSKMIEFQAKDLKTAKRISEILFSPEAIRGGLSKKNIEELNWLNKENEIPNAWLNQSMEAELGEDISLEAMNAHVNVQQYFDQNSSLFWKNFIKKVRSLHTIHEKLSPGKLYFELRKLESRLLMQLDGPVPQEFRSAQLEFLQLKQKLVKRLGILQSPYKY